jgi:CRISPR-associated protein Cmr1
LFLGGADQRPELRAPSFKGVLRFWYRAVDPDFAMSEERFFGGVSDNAAQIPFLLRVVPTKLTEVNWSELRPRRFDQGRGSSSTRSGLIYRGFPFGMRGEERSAIAPAQEFELCGAIIREENNPAFRQALLPTWWLLGHLGGVGSRSRRGFGCLALTDWRIEPDHADWPE